MRSPPTADVVSLATGAAVPAVTTIRLGASEHGLAVLLDVAIMMTSRCAIQGTSGAGKSYLLRRILEQCNGRVQQVVLDPDGEFVSLAEVYEYVVLSAADALRIGGGGVALDLRTRRYDLVVDLSDATAEERAQFTADLCAGLVDADRSLWRPLLLAIDEVQKFAGKGDDGDVEKQTRLRTIKKLADLMDRGRKRGLSAIVATSRISETASPVVSKAGNWLIGRTVFDRDVERAAFVLGKTKGKVAGLRRLADGEFIGSGPALGPKTVRFTAAEVRSRHGGQAPGLEPPPLLSAEDARAGLAALVTAAIARPVAIAVPAAPAKQRRGYKRWDAWKPEEDEIIRAAYAEAARLVVILERLAAAGFNRSASGISVRAKVLGLVAQRAQTRWTPPEDEILSGGYKDGRTLAGIMHDLAAAGFERHRGAIQMRAIALGITGNRVAAFDPREVEIMKGGLERGDKHADILAALRKEGFERSVSALDKVKKRYGLFREKFLWSTEQIEALRKCYQAGLGPKGAMLALREQYPDAGFTYLRVTQKASQMNFSVDRSWSQEDIDLVVNGQREGRRLVEVAAEIAGRHTYGAVARMAAVLNLDFRTGRRATEFSGGGGQALAKPDVPQPARAAELSRAS
jgi:uncharacterized protein DUF87